MKTFRRRTFLAALAAGAMGGPLLGAAPEADKAASWTVSAREPDAALESGARLLRFTVTGADEVDFQVVRFAASRCALHVVDQPSKTAAGTLRKAMEHLPGAIAGVNGGFFTREFEPLGLVIGQGQRKGEWQRSSLLGGVVVVRKGRLMLLWRDEFQEAAGTTELLQAGPRLVNHGTAVTGLESDRNRPRTFIATDNEGHWLLGIAQSTSLSHLAQILATPGLLPDFAMDRALNFDGGRSTGLWVRLPTGDVHYEEEFSTVRNFVAITGKEPASGR